MAWFLLRPFGRMRCSGKLPIVPEIRTMAFHIAEYVSAVSSVTTSPERDCDPCIDHKDGFQALGSDKDRFLIRWPICHARRFTLVNIFKCVTYI